MKLFKKAGLGLLILMLSFGVYLIVTDDIKVRNSVLYKTLGLFGEELLAMVPKSPQKTMLEQQYRDFMEKAERQQVSVQQVENVAAAILKIKNTQDSVNVQTAMDALKRAQIDSRYPGTPPQWPDMSDKELALRLEKMREFQNELETLYKSDSALVVFKKRVFFVADSGIRVVMDDTLQNMPEMFAVKDIDSLIQSLEGNKMIKWTVNETELRRLLKGIEKNLEIELDDMQFDAKLPDLGALDSVRVRESERGAR